MSYKRLIQQVNLFYKLAQYGDRSRFLNALGQAASLSGPTPPVPGSPGTAGGRPLTLEEKLRGQPNQTLNEYTPPAEATIPTISVEDLPKTPSAPVQAPKIDKEIQTQLNAILVPSGDILPLKEDGILGPETQKALM